MDGEPGRLIPGLPHRSTAYLRRPGLALGERPLSHGRNVLTLMLCSLQTALLRAARRSPQSPRAQLPGPGAVHSLEPQTWPGLRLPGPRVGVCPLEQKAVAAGAAAPTAGRQPLPSKPPTCAAGEGGAQAAGQRHRPPTACASDSHPGPNHAAGRKVPPPEDAIPAQQCRPTQGSPGQAPGPAGVGSRLWPPGRPRPHGQVLRESGSRGALAHGVRPGRHHWPPL